MLGLVWHSRSLQLLVPLLWFCGLEQSFIWGDYTSTYIKPTIGFDNIGYVMATFGAADVVASRLFGQLSDRLGRATTLAVGVLVHGATAVLLYAQKAGVGSDGAVPAGSWLTPCSNGHVFDTGKVPAGMLPGNGTASLFPQCVLVPGGGATDTVRVDCGECLDGQWGWLIACAAVWGVGDAVWNTQAMAILAACWPTRTEDAFANGKMFQAMMGSIVFIYNPYVDTTIRLNILLAMLCLVVPCYLLRHARARAAGGGGGACVGGQQGDAGVRVGSCHGIG